MESMQTIKRRIKAVINTAQITKAMEMVSANKMRRSQEIALASRPYALTALHLLRELSNRAPHLPSLMEKRKNAKTLVVLVSADKGLAGSLNSNVFRRFEKELGKYPPKTHESYGELSYAAVGKKAEEYLGRKGLASIRSFVNFGDYIDTEETRPLAEFATKGFLNGDWDQVLVLSTHFRTTLRQDVIMRKILPVTYKSLEHTIKEIVPEHGRYAELAKAVSNGGPSSGWEYLIEPSPAEVLDELAKHLLEIEIYHLILEANASEHSARMVAMKSASDNASELESDLTLLYNKSRQAGITKEIAEITAGAESLKQ